MIGYLLQGSTLGISAGASPGPFQAYLLSHAMLNGWRRAMPAAAAPLITDVAIVSVVIFLLTQLPGVLLNILQVIGAVFILYLAWGATRVFRDGRVLDREAIRGSDAARRGFLKAIVMNFLNPGPYVFWSTIAGPIVLRAWAEAPSWAISFVAGFYTALVILNAVLILLFGAASELGPKITRTLQGFSALALLVFGIYQLWTGITRFL